MKCGILAITMVLCVATAATAGDGRPSSDTLSKLGLSSLQLVSDTDAMQVRGKAFVQGDFAVRLVGGGGSFATAGRLQDGIPFTNTPVSAQAVVISIETQTDNGDGNAIGGPNFVPIFGPGLFTIGFGGPSSVRATLTASLFFGPGTLAAP